MAARLKPAACAILQVICMHLDVRLTAFPSDARIMKLTGVGKHQLKEGKRVLEKEGVLERWQEIGEGGRFSHTKYRVTTRFISVFVEVSSLGGFQGERVEREELVEEEPLVDFPPSENGVPLVDFPPSVFPLSENRTLSILPNGSILNNGSIVAPKKKKKVPRVEESGEKRRNLAEVFDEFLVGKGKTKMVWGPGKKEPVAVYELNKNIGASGGVQVIDLSGEKLVEWLEMAWKVADPFIKKGFVPSLLLSQFNRINQAIEEEKKGSAGKPSGFDYSKNQKGF